MLGFSHRLSQCCIRDSQIRCQRTYYTDTLEPTVQGPSVQKARVCETENVKGQIKK
jgi:hypothetical protein